MLNNLELVNAAWNADYSNEYDNCIVLDRGPHCVVIMPPYASAAGNNPNYLVSRNNEKFLKFGSFVQAMDAAANLLR